jgi:hypothetical protein
MRGLDPRIHHKKCSFKTMDCRVKPGNDVVTQLIMPPSIMCTVPVT